MALSTEEVVDEIWDAIDTRHGLNGPQLRDISKLCADQVMQGFINWNEVTAVVAGLGLEMKEGWHAPR